MANLQQELEELKEKLQSLSDIFKCPVCWEVLDKDNISCVNGHSVCTKCIGVHRVCPSCRGNFSNLQQNAMVRQVLGVLSRKCKFCPEMVHPGDDEHEKYCVFRPTSCQDTLCEWNGPVLDLATHLKDDHNKLIFPESNIHVWHSNYDPNKKSRIVTMYSAFGHFMWQIRKNDPELGLLTYTYIPVLVEKPSHDIWVKRILESEKIKYNIAIKINLDEDVDHFKENSTSIPIVMLNSFIHKRCLYFSLFMKKEDDS